MHATKRIGIVIFEGADLMDFAGPVSVFHCAANQLSSIRPASDVAYTIEPLSIDGGLVTTLEGVAVETAVATDIADGHFDTIIMAGGKIDETNCDARLISWLQRNHQSARR